MLFWYGRIYAVASYILVHLLVLIPYRYLLGINLEVRWVIGLGNPQGLEPYSEIAGSIPYIN